MTDWISRLAVFAQNEAQPRANPNEPLAMFIPMIAILVLFYFMLIRPQQKREQATRDAMLSTLKKNDRVVTIGGIIGTVANISPDGQEITLKVDDNTRIRFVRTSIQRIMSGDTSSDKPAGTA